MASAILNLAFGAASHSLPITDALSGIFGSISMTAWICLLIPQLMANYRAQSADGLSMAFLIVWLLGDATNLIGLHIDLGLGALFTHLAPTAVALASYFCVADMVLISQCVYYNTRNARRLKQAESTQTSEQSPLLARRRGSSVGNSDSAIDGTTKATEIEDGIPDGGSAVNNALSLVAVYGIGFAGWFLSYKAGAWDIDEPGVPEPPSDEKNVMEIVGLTLGYMSAVCYLWYVAQDPSPLSVLTTRSARVPQILKNYREKSCEGEQTLALAKLCTMADNNVAGLAILFFMLSLTGNLTYGISLVAYSQEKKYLLNALPWLLGSIGTIVEDCIIFVQFRLYSNNSRSTVVPA
ncbi:hypothetical protein S40288_03424 [Stachybotrys chartarum IBT 40288]|nr:hypothetical protein S40288_03424 [Stachybotrys chartarum IBT 40288]